MLPNVSRIAGRFFTTEPPAKPSMLRTAPHNKEFSISKHLRNFTVDQELCPIFMFLKLLCMFCMNILQGLNISAWRNWTSQMAQWLRIHLPIHLPVVKEMWVQSLVRKIPWRRKWQPAPIFLPGKSVDKEGWWVTVFGVAKNLIGLSTQAHEKTTSSTIF